jgi:RNA polymerase sigma-70 factor (ECF subfamily)
MAHLNGNALHTQQTSETQIVARAIDGDADAFGILYQRYLDPIYNYIYYRVTNRLEAEDLTESVFYKAWCALDENPPKEIPFRLWLYRIAHNNVVDYYRAGKEEVGLEAIADVPDPLAGPEATLAGRERVAAVRSAVQQLKPEHQQVILCRFVVGLCHAETALVLERSEEATRALQYRALMALKDLLFVQEGPYV